MKRRSFLKGLMAIPLAAAIPKFIASESPANIVVPDDIGDYTGMYVGTGEEGNSINIGFKPDYVFVKNIDNPGCWKMIDYRRQ